MRRNLFQGAILAAAALLVLSFLAACGKPKDQVAEGKTVFEQNCAVCHNITSEPKTGPGLAGIFQKATLPNGAAMTEENMKSWITTGYGEMPAYPLPAEKLDALIAYLKTL